MTRPSTWEHDELRRLLIDLCDALGDPSGADLARSDWYPGLLPPEAAGAEEARSPEHALAAAAIAHPDLHPLLVRLVRRLTEIGDLWVGTDEPAGTGFATALALYDAAYVPLYAEFLTSNDLGQEVSQSEDIQEILHRWGWGPQTYTLFWARMFTPGQHAEEDFADFLTSGLAETLDDHDELAAFLNAVHVLSFDRGAVLDMFDDDRIVAIFAALFPDRDETFARAFFEVSNAGEDGYVVPVTVERIEAYAFERLGYRPEVRVEDD